MKKLLILIAIVFSMTLFSFSAAAENQVTKIDAEIIINDDGSAYFYQTWQCNFSQDTEVYYFFPDEGRYEISNLVVWDEDKTYETVNDWDTSLSFNEKAGKCGILEYGDGYELCWGITEYGEKTYNIYFKIDNLVTAYKDADATYFALFSENVDTRPTDVSVKLSLANGKDLVDGRIFEDGEFSIEGNCSFITLGYSGDDTTENGFFYTKTYMPLASDDKMALSFVFEKGLINPVSYKNKSASKSESDFIDNYYFNKSSSSSSSGNWYDDEFNLLILGLIIYLGLPLIIYLIIVISYKTYLRSVTRKSELCRNEPSLGIEASYLMLKDFKLSDDKNLLTLIFLDMIKAGAITPMLPDAGDPIPVEKGNVRFRINPAENSEELSETEQNFYKFLSLAAKDDKILEPYELTVKSQDYFYTLRKIMDAYTAAGKLKIEGSEIKRNSKIFSGPLTYTVKGKEELRKVLGYKKYLTEYSSHNSADYYAYDLWENAMRYSAVFGDSDKIRDELLKAYPSSHLDIKEYSKNLLFAQQAAKLMAKNIKHSEKNYSSGKYNTNTYTTYYTSSTRYRGSGGGFRSGGGGFGGGGGGRSGGGTR